MCALLSGVVASAGAETLVVANQHDQSLSLIDTASGKVVATFRWVG